MKIAVIPRMLQASSDATDSPSSREFAQFRVSDTAIPRANKRRRIWQLSSGEPFLYIAVSRPTLHPARALV